MAEGAVCDDGIDIFVLQLELSETQYEGRVDDNGTENDTISACWSDKMPHGLVVQSTVVSSTGYPLSRSFCVRFS